MNALSDFLRSRRARLTPADVGLTGAGLGHRRVPGLRREEVAALAGVSTDYYVRLEQGRGAHVSDAVLDAVGRALRLDATERAYLTDLARPKRPVRRAFRAPRPAVRRLVDAIPGAPAILTDHRMVIVAANQLGAALFGLTGDPATRDRARVFFLDPRARELYRDWAADAETVTASLRLLVARYPDDPWLTTLIGELSIKSPQFRTLWGRHRVKHKTHGAKRLRHPIAGDLDLTYERLSIAGDGDHALIVYQAEPGSPTAERLALLASWTA
ncbi:helix-turn-helix transcriptional regulator [Dactylosporangium sp. CA-092794]|uniref:helix-turn-helix transcriptional regulator n=1 Tax=Dactylosporangium sp. CA-092794 TaxID=3239929 RepID=UPI003D8E56A9